MFLAMGNCGKRQWNYADDIVSPISRQNTMQQDMIQQQQLRKDDVCNPETSSGHSWSSSPETFYRPSSAAARNSPTVYV